MLEQKIFDFAMEVKEVSDDGRFSGYASTFGGDPDSYGDVIAAGAFAASLAKNGYGGNGIKMLWQHNPDDPIGVWTQLREDGQGLFVEGQLALGTTRGKDAYELLKIGAVNTMSIGFRIVKYSEDRDRDIRTLEEIDLYEVSLVTFPANTSAKITAVKTNKEQVERASADVRELEKLLRDAGFSRDAAKTMISYCRVGLKQKRDASDIDVPRLLSEVRAARVKLAGLCGTRSTKENDKEKTNV